MGSNHELDAWGQQGEGEDACVAENLPSGAVTHAGRHAAVLGNDDIARTFAPQALATGSHLMIRFERAAELVRALRAGTSFGLVVASLGGLSDDAVTDVRVLRHAGGSFMPLLLLAHVQRPEEFAIFDTDATIHWVPMPCDRSEVMAHVVTAVAAARSRKAWSFGHYSFLPLLQVVSINGRPACGPTSSNWGYFSFATRVGRSRKPCSWIRCRGIHRGMLGRRVSL